MSDTQTKTATLVKNNLPRFRGDAALYRLDPPLAGHEFVIASAVDLSYAFDDDDPVCETYLFPGDAQGNVTDWGELDGSLKNTKSHAEALSAAGYEVSA